MNREVDHWNQDIYYVLTSTTLLVHPATETQDNLRIKNNGYVNSIIVVYGHSKMRKAL